MKQKYITPSTEIIRLLTDDNIAQFIVSSRTIGEDSGESKGGYFDDEEDEEETNPNPWDEPLF